MITNPPISSRLLLPFFVTGLLIINSSPSVAYEDEERLSSKEFYRKMHMKPLNNENMNEVAAQGIREDSDYLIELGNNNGPQEEAGQRVFTFFLQSVLGGLNLVTDYEISDVTYSDPDAERVVLNEDGSFTILMPSRIGEIAYRDLSVSGSTGQIIGDLFFRDIRMTDASVVTLIPRPE